MTEPYREYALNPVILQIGEQTYAVPRWVINSEKGLLSRMRPLGHGGLEYIRLDGIYQDIAHTLVNFLHTGLYETIRGPDGRWGEYRRSVHAYAASKEFEIKGLDKHARQYMHSFGDAADVFGILNVAREVWPTLYTDRYYLEHVLNMILSAFEGDRDLFKKDDFMRYFGTLDEAFTMFLAQVVVRGYSRDSSKSKDEESKDDGKVEGHTAVEGRASEEPAAKRQRNE